MLAALENWLKLVYVGRASVWTVCELYHKAVLSSISDFPKFNWFLGLLAWKLVKMTESIWRARY